MEKQLEYRMYGLVPYNISPIQQGIQFGHALQEYNNKLGDIALTDEGNQLFEAFNRWKFFDKTFIILNGGTTNKKRISTGFKGTLNTHHNSLLINKIYEANFYEPDLGDQLTAVVFLVDERVWNKEKYPDFPPFEEGDLDGQTEDYLNWIDSVGGEKNVWLRDFLSQFRLA